jgi:hypothetical protein
MQNIGKWEPSKELIEKIREHQALVKCPYCKNQFDIHAGIIFLEGKQIESPPGPGRQTEAFFKEVMKKKE